MTRLKITIRGAVQGVGFRPFVYRLATGLGLRGWVSNSPQGVFIEAEGPGETLEAFLLRLESERPPRSFIQSLEASWLAPESYATFEIRPSDAAGEKTALVLPDIATCPDCLREIFDPANRRHFYPFTNCTHCGPRFSIIESLPYDRANTSMKVFGMCPMCRAEYENPADRRFHAQPNACPMCGPHLELWDGRGVALASDAVKRDRPAATPSPSLNAAVEAIRAGKIVAVKGLGGFHLVVAAGDDAAVRRLRDLKHREEKPLAVMFPSLGVLRKVCEVSPLEERLLRSPEAPIVLVRRRPAGGRPEWIAPSVAPANPNLGALLAYTPVHHLLLSLLGGPVVATSGNLSDEPICTNEREALERLRGIADLFLVHNRPIVRHVDDSVARVMAGREIILRRARGYAPLPLQIPGAGPESKTILAVGGHLKNAVALAKGSQVFISQHIGDLETEPANEAFRRVIADFEKLYEASPSAIAADAHPGYLSTQFARAAAAPDAGAGPAPAAGTTAAKPRLFFIQHHLAHVLSCMAENELPPPVLGVSWDGTGYGMDGGIWGGEFFVITETAFERVAHLRSFRLPGGDAAVKEPRRAALGLLYEQIGDAAFEQADLSPVASFTPGEAGPLRQMLARGVNSPRATSAGRLFDAVAALTGLRQKVRFEGQAAMELEFAICDLQTEDHYPVPAAAPTPGTNGTAAGLPLILDWAPMIHAIVEDIRTRTPVGLISAKFHNTLVEMILLVACHARLERVVLTGGCFQNRYLTERAARRLSMEGFHPFWHQRVPPNDGGIALGQVLGALRELQTAK